MNTALPPEFIRLLANEVRWGLLQALSRSDYQVNELVTQLQQPMNLISYHLKKMREEALVTTRRSEADGRDVYYSLDLPRLHELYFAAGAALHPGLTSPSPQAVPLPIRRVLLVCTHNSARSQMAEGWLRHLSQGQLQVWSAGSQPTQVHPDAIRTMAAFGIDLRSQQSQSLQVFAGQTFDYVITVCDKAREICPTFGSAAVQLHWSLPDPVQIADPLARQAAFERIAQQLKTRSEYFLFTLSSV